MRLIDADALFDSMNSLDYESTVKAYEAIAEAPTIDAVEIVRCKDCVHFRTYALASDAEVLTDCAVHTHRPQEDGYCSYGEREDND